MSTDQTLLPIGRLEEAAVDRRIDQIGDAIRTARWSEPALVHLWSVAHDRGPVTQASLPVVAAALLAILEIDPDGRVAGWDDADLLFTAVSIVGHELREDR